MKPEQLNAYDSWNKKPKYFKMNKIDNDSIVNFVQNQGIWKIDKKYSEPKALNGQIRMNSGVCKESYIIIVDHNKIELPIESAYDFELPASINEFDVLFKRITSKYIHPN
jgi:hypothetical protein